MTGRTGIDEVSGKVGGDSDSPAKRFVETLKAGAYAKIDERYFQLLWRALRQAPEGKLARRAEDDFFACLARGGRQMDVIRHYAREGCPCFLDSPFARVFFNLFGNRVANGGGA